ncbi:interferon-inducible double-stranded RNA-dependent protein kinase activator A isoform X2 [Heteronotia binoei]|uniref:interferon-inducible double-stranded RNA-dependent protein kinase activator A isoform X2 n=1 Tax=Heteronotia binoei TaxID=13085 RepID=UPI00293142EB|nr:interferon-inducible double-stranded RNA-dependent protein kinase activator A isoform X2 [Heteronotia binoei]
MLPGEEEDEEKEMAAPLSGMALVEALPCPAMPQEGLSGAEQQNSTAAKQNPLSLEEIIKANPEKTPIQLLHEYCTKANITPVYEFEKNEEQMHLPVFTFKVSLGEITGTGEGSSKKSAKHKAAEAALNMLKDNPNLCISMPDHMTLEPCNQAQNQTNPIGLLQEMAIQKRWRLPEYSFEQETGPSHMREFTVTCRVETLEGTGTATSKKLAKRNAAEKVLDKLDELCNSFGDSINFFSGIEQSHKLRCMRDILRNSSGEKMKLLRWNPLGVLSTDYVELLDEIAEEQGFNATYLYLEEPSMNGQHQCLAELSTSPVIVCHGTGISWENAKTNAAYNTLQYLKIMAGRK